MALFWRYTDGVITAGPAVMSGWDIIASGSGADVRQYVTTSAANCATGYRRRMRTATQGAARRVRSTTDDAHIPMEVTSGVTLVNPIIATAGTTDGVNTFITAPIDIRANDAVFLFWAAELAGTAGAISCTSSLGGLTFTSLRDANDFDFHRSAVLGGIASTAGRTTLTFTAPANGTQRYAFQVVIVHNAGSIVQHNNSSGNFTANPSATFAAAPSSTSTLLSFCHIEDVTAVEPGAGWARINTVPQVKRGTTVSATVGWDTGSTSTSVPFTTTYANWSHVIGVEVAPAAGGTTFTANLAGSITPAGALAKAASAAKAGSTTPSGALAKRPAKSLAGSTTPSGALAKLVAKALAGSTTPSGTLATSRVILVALAGSITPSGALAKVVAKALAGSATPSGALAKADAKALAGSTTPTGAVAKRADKALAGSSTPSGVLTTTRVLLRAFAGSITPSGALAKVANKALAGATTPSGALAKRPAKALVGSVAPSGALAKLARKAFAGAITALGNLATSVSGPVGIPIGGGLDTYVTALGGLDTYVSQMGAADAYAVQMGAADTYVQPTGGADAYTTTLGGI